MTLEEYMRERYTYWTKLKRFVGEHELTARLYLNIERLISGAWGEE